jgi:CheY-like chemotaxis protein/HPt (histidine-containing phosphotransfer) domain-containing protein
VPGKGSTFWFVVALEHALGPARDEEARAAAQLAMATPKPYRILVAEDNPINQLVITQQLLSLGFGVSAVANGEEVLAALDEERFDLIFMDCQMPRLDGYEATRRIRVRPGADSRIPIVALTANAMKGDLERCLAVGMNEYISKPFRQDTLIRTLERWLLGRQLGPPPEPAAPSAPTGDDAIDPDRLASLRALGAAAGQDLLGELLARFRTQAQVIELRRALDAGDRAQLRFVAHSLKGSSGTLGAMRLSRLSAQLEEQAESAPLDACAEQLALLGEEYLRVLTQLAEACEKEAAQR